MEVRWVDGTIQVFESAGVLDGRQYWRPVEMVDPYDNRSVWQYDGHGRVVCVSGPDGIDELWNYAPDWIGGVQGWDGATYSGVEVRYVDRFNPTVELHKGRNYLFKRRRDLAGQLVPGSKPFGGDLLYRVYLQRAAVLPDLQDIRANELFDVSSIETDFNQPGQWRVVQYDYVPETPLVSTISQVVAFDVLPGSATSSTIPIVTYTYSVVAGQARFLTEHHHQEGGLTYAYNYVPNFDATNVVQTTRTDSLGGQV